MSSIRDFSVYSPSDRQKLNFPSLAKSNSRPRYVTLQRARDIQVENNRLKGRLETMKSALPAPIDVSQQHSTAAASLSIFHSPVHIRRQATIAADNNHLLAAIRRLHSRPAAFQQTSGQTNSRSRTMKHSKSTPALLSKNSANPSSGTENPVAAVEKESEVAETDTPADNGTPTEGSSPYFDHNSIEHSPYSPNFHPTQMNHSHSTSAIGHTHAHNHTLTHTHTHTHTNSHHPHGSPSSSPSSSDVYYHCRISGHTTLLRAAERPKVGTPTHWNLFGHMASYPKGHQLQVSLAAMKEFFDNPTTDAELFEPANRELLLRRLSERLYFMTNKAWKAQKEREKPKNQQSSSSAPVANPYRLRLGINLQKPPKADEKHPTEENRKSINQEEPNSRVKIEQLVHTIHLLAGSSFQESIEKPKENE